MQFFWVFFCSCQTRAGLHERSGQDPPRYQRKHKLPSGHVVILRAPGPGLNDPRSGLLPQEILRGQASCVSLAPHPEWH